MPTVYGTPLSPYVSKVLITLDYKQVMYELNPIPADYQLVDYNSPTDTNLLDAYNKISPLGKVPAYQDEAVTLTDSSVICDYLEHRYPSPELFPIHPVKKAELRLLEEFSDSMLAPVFESLFVEKVIKPKLLDQTTDHGKVNDLVDNNIPDLFDYLEEHIPDSGYILGPYLTFADIAIGSSFMNGLYMDFVVDSKKWEKLANYIRQFLAEGLVVNRAKHNLALLGR